MNDTRIKILRELNDPIGAHCYRLGMGIGLIWHGVHTPVFTQVSLCIDDIVEDTIREFSKHMTRCEFRTPSK